MEPLDQVTFDSRRFELVDEDRNVRVWKTPAGDGLFLHHFAYPPDIAANLDDRAGLIAHYRGVAYRAGLGVLEIEPIVLDGCRALRTLFKAPQEPHGRIYVGSITVPFRDFSYVLKVQCDEEPGITGVRDMAILQKLQQSGGVTFGEDGEVEGWLTDPYDPSERGPMTRNKSELEAYDPMFPQHPLSLARAILRHLEETVRIADEIRSAPPFVFPPGGGRIDPVIVRATCDGGSDSYSPGRQSSTSLPSLHTAKQCSRASDSRVPSQRWMFLPFPSSQVKVHRPSRQSPSTQRGASRGTIPQLPSPG